jgi:hypothetical protein
MVKCALGLAAEPQDSDLLSVTIQSEHLSRREDMNTKDTIYLDNSATATDMIRRRDAVRAVSKTPGLRFIYQVHAPKPGRIRRCNLLPDRSIIEPSPIAHKSIREVV